MTLFIKGFQKNCSCSYALTYLMIGVALIYSSNNLAAETLMPPTKGWYVDEKVPAAFMDYRDGISIYVTFGTSCKAAVLGVSDRYNEEGPPEAAELRVDGQHYRLPFLGFQQGESAFRLSVEALRALKMGHDGKVFTNTLNYRLPLSGSSAAIVKARAICERQQ